MAAAIQPSTRISLELDDLSASRLSQPTSTTALDLDAGDPAWHADVQGDRPREFPVELPPIDGGVRAWSFLAASYVLELLVWGLPLANGVFLEYYERHLFKDTPSSLLPLIGSLASGLNYILAFPTMSLSIAYPTLRRPAMLVGLAMAIAGLLGASFSTTPMQLLMTQGFLLSVGGSLLYWPVSTYLWEWFERKRGLAVGILFSGTGAGGFALPLIIEKLLDLYGHQTTLQALAVAFAVLVAGAAPFIKGRVPDSVVKSNRRISFKFVYKRSFWFLLVVSIVQGMGNFGPQLYLPSFATGALGRTPFEGTLALALMNASNGFGYPLFGHLADKHLNFGIISSSLVSILSVFFLWGFSTSYGVLIVFALAYGFVSPSYGAFWSGWTRLCQGDPSETVLLFSIMVCTRGMGNLASGPMANALLAASAGSGFSKAHGAYGLDDGKWGATIVFTGLCACVGLTAAFAGKIPKGEKERQMDEDRAA